MSNKPVKPFRPYWDANIFISSIQRTPGRVEVIDDIKRMVKENRLLVVTSSIVMTEVIKWDDETGLDLDVVMKKIRDYLENPWITRRFVDNAIAERAGQLRRRFKLKGMDAIHLATAWRYEVDVLQTYDEDLLKLDGSLSFEKKADKLKIRYPEVPDKSYPLFENAED